MDFLPEGYELDTFTTHRNNEEVSLNSYGEQLIQLSIASKLRVLNGRKRGDLQGHFTYLGYPGCSTVDLVLASEKIFQTNTIQYFSVQTFMTILDHRPIPLKILWKYSTRVDETTTSNCTLEDKPRRFIWNNNLEKLSTETLEKELRSIKWKDFNELQTNKIENINIHNRIENEIESKDISSPSQAGIRKNYRTTDHIFTLFSLIKKALCKGKYLYTCFVDFRKAYDSTCRKRLLYSLRK